MPSVDDHQDYRSYLESRLTAVEAKLHAVEEKFEDRFLSQEKAVAAALTAAKESNVKDIGSAKEAVNKAELAVEKRLEGMNEFRGTLSDQAATLMPRSEAENRFHSLSEKLNELNSRMDRNEGRGSGLNAGLVYLINGVGLIAAIIGIFLALK